MNILAIDTSCGACSSAVYDGEQRYVFARESEPMARERGEALAPMVQRVLAATPGGTGSLKRIAVTIGPGSFTGLRMGIATAKAMGVALEIPVVGVSTLLAYCSTMLDNPRPGVIAAVIDAHNGQVYFQLIDAKAKPIISPRMLSLRDAVRAIGGSPARVVGDAAVALAEEARRVGVELDASASAPYPDIVALARIGFAADPAAWPARPLLIKPLDAVSSRDASFARSGP